MAPRNENEYFLFWMLWVNLESELEKSRVMFWFSNLCSSSVPLYMYPVHSVRIAFCRGRGVDSQPPLSLYRSEIMLLHWPRLEFALTFTSLLTQQSTFWFNLLQSAVIYVNFYCLEHFNDVISRLNNLWAFVAVYWGIFFFFINVTYIYIY